MHSKCNNWHTSDGLSTLLFLNSLSSVSLHKLSEDSSRIELVRFRSSISSSASSNIASMHSSIRASSSNCCITSLSNSSTFSIHMYSEKSPSMIGASEGLSGKSDVSEKNDVTLAQSIT
uniref:Uncharacterized protein n=1 Tax=Cacopsylla melanoneura TaxID=428564 RepID=A0A8D9EAP5_9HEMI